MKKYTCLLCKSFASTKYLQLINHIHSIHHCEESRKIVCGFDGCLKTFQSDQSESLRQHYYSKHKNKPAVLIQTPPVISAEPFAEMHTEIPVIDEDGIVEGMDCTMEVEDASSEPALLPSNASFKREIALFILKTLEERKVTQSAIDGIISDLKNIFDRLQKIIQETLTSVGVNMVLADIINQEVLKPFDGLTNEYQRTKYLQNNLSFVPPIQRTLGQTTVNQHAKFVQQIDTCYDVSLLKQLQQLLQCDVVSQQVFNSHAQDSHSGKMCDFCDGELYKNNLLFQQFPNSLEIHLYYDEVDVCNPIGSRRTIYKLGMFYFCIGNLNPVLRSKLKSIYLLNMCYYSDIKKYGIDTILEPIIKEVRILEKGFEFDLPNGRKKVIYGTLTLISADNLSSQLMAGYKGLNSAFRKCQRCLATDLEMQNVFNECMCAFRTYEMHKEHCERIIGAFREYMAITYGITRNSILNELTYFNIVDGICMDIMHDLLEGVLQLVIKHMLKKYVDDGLITLDLVNARLKAFRFSKSDMGNLPTEIRSTDIASDDNKLCENASQTWCLARALPFLIGDKIPNDNNIWSTFICLLRITELSLAPVLTKAMTMHLGTIIERFLNDFKMNFGMRLTPKMHYLIHIPSSINKFGPLLQSWCMRFEAKHRFFKHLAKVTGNFKNILKTLATRHQRYMTWLLSEPKYYLQETVECGKCYECELGSQPDVCNQILKYSIDGLDAKSTIYGTKRVTVHGTEYRLDDVVVLPPVDGEVRFAVINQIYLFGKNCFFRLLLLETSNFNSHYNAYEVKHFHPEVFLVARQSDLWDFYPLVVNKTFDTQMCNNLFVRLKHAILSE